MNRKISILLIKSRMHVLHWAIVLISIFAVSTSCSTKKKLSKDVIELNDSYLNNDTLKLKN